MGIDNIDINIMMIGGRRCGKTSVLAAMQNSFDSEFGKSNLTIKVDNESIIPLTDKLDEMNNLYAKKEKELRFTPDDNPTSEKTPYGIEISLKSKPNGKILYHFIDFPGEWFTSEEKVKEYEKDLETIQNSSVIIIAIDTPYLMEELPEDTDNMDEAIGRFNEPRNRSKVICNFLKKLNLNKTEKMVIFVPLKAERYRHEGRMYQVNKKVHIAYKSFFDHINNDFNRKNCTTIIAPIFTLGTVEFTRFEYKDANIILDEKFKYPKYPLYHFTDKAGNSPEPKYCEQPLLYVLLYILKTAEKAKKDKNKNFWNKIFMYFGEKFFDIPSADDFAQEVKNIQKGIKTKGDGYEIITDPYGLKG